MFKSNEKDINLIQFFFFFKGHIRTENLILPYMGMGYKA